MTILTKLNKPQMTISILNYTLTPNIAFATNLWCYRKLLLTFSWTYPMSVQGAPLVLEFDHLLGCTPTSHSVSGNMDSQRIES